MADEFYNVVSLRLLLGFVSLFGFAFLFGFGCTAILEFCEISLVVCLFVVGARSNVAAGGCFAVRFRCVEAGLLLQLWLQIC